MAEERDRNDATTEEKRPINNIPADGEVTIKDPSPKPSGCYLTRVKCTLIVILIICLALLLAAAVGFLGWFVCSSYSKSDSDAWDERYRATPKPTVAPHLPWADIRLPGDIIPSFYDIQLKVDLDKFSFSGSVEIEVLAQRNTRYAIIHINQLEIVKNHVSIVDIASGRDVAIERHIKVPVNQFYVLQIRDRLKAGRKYRIRFGEFTGILQDDLRGLYRSKYKDEQGNTRYLATSQLQSVDARKVFPCFDEPALKAKFKVSITHTPAYTALSNMPKNRTHTLSSGWVKDVFETTPAMSTYLLAFVIADFRYRETVTQDNLKIRIWAQPDMYDQTQYPLDFAVKGYKFFSNYFGMPEIVPKADHVAIPDFSAGAMENWGLVLYRETALLHDEEKSSIANKYYVSLVMAHEISHTWFGNMVTMKWWDDLWLNEGFANTLMYFALDDINPDWQVFDLQLVSNIYPVMTKDSLLTSHAISTPIRDPDEISQFFDSISYDKGMAVLRLLRGFLGWDDFRKGLQTYVKNFKYKNAEVSELWKTFAEAVDHKYKVGEIMDTWTRQMGFPVVTVKMIRNGTYKLEQHRFLLNPDDKYTPSNSQFGYKWYIPFIYKVQGDSKTKTRTQWMDLTSAQISVPPGAWIIGNVDYMGFYRTNYDQNMWQKLITQLKKDHTVFSAANRAGLISDAFNLARANKLKYEIALEMASYLKNEKDFVPWKAFLDSMEFLKGMLATSNAYGKLKQYIFDLVAPIYRSVGTSDQGELLERNLRSALLEAAVKVQVPDAIRQAQTMFNSWETYGTKFPRDYAVVVFSVGIQQGGEEAWENMWSRAQTTRVASEAEIMMEALAHTQEPWLLWRYVRWSLDSKKIRMQDVRNLFRYFGSTTLGRSTALQFLLTSWDEINTRFGMDVFLLRDIIYATTSLINTEFEYKLLKRLYRERPPAGVASKAADNSLALIRSNINWMKLNHDTIANWLTEHSKAVKSSTSRTANNV